MYKLINDFLTNKTSGVLRSIDNACIPFASDNTDYQQFKKELANGVELKDAEGNPITGSALTTFIGTLP